MNLHRLPHALAGAGLLLCAVMVVEVIAIARSPEPFHIVAIVNFLATLPFVGMLLGGAYWLPRIGLSPDRYPRIAGWTLGGFGFMVTFFAIIALFTQQDLLARIGIVRWGAAAGAGTGALVGIFEARAIHRALSAERTRIRNEELQRHNDHLEELTSVLSHDLRNPLNVAAGYLEVVRDEYGHEAFDRIAMAHDRMAQLIEETLLLARSGQLIGETDEVPLRDLVTESWQNVHTDAATLTIVSEGTITADPGRLRHLFENLFRNAIEHGGSDVVVRVGILPHGFYVEDDGRGIPEDVRASVLESGFSTTQGGTGFGLAIVRQIVEAHGWDLTVTESDDGGARIEVTGVDTGPSASTGTADVESPPVH